jgi:hypothetical protein
MNMVRRRNHSGVTLLETVVVIGVQTVLLATAVALIGRLLEAERTGRENSQASMSIEALSRQFRHDVNTAREASIVETKGSPAGIQLQLSGGRITTYESQAGRVLRYQRRGEEVLHREAYRLPPSWGATFHELPGTGEPPVLRPDGPPRMLRMTVADLNCDAVLGRDLDVAAPEEGGGS